MMQVAVDGDPVPKRAGRRRYNSTMIVEDAAPVSVLESVWDAFPFFARCRLRWKKLVSTSVRHHAAPAQLPSSFLSPLHLHPHVANTKFSDTVVTFDASEASLCGAVSIRGIRNANEDTYRVITDLEKYKTSLFVAESTKAPTEVLAAHIQSSIFDSEEVLKAKEASWFLPSEISHVPSSSTQFYGVYDGHAGRRCSAIVARALPLCILATGDTFHTNLTECLKTSCLDMDKKFLDLAATRGYKDGSTAITVLKRNDEIYVANIGDCRAILVSFDPASTVPKVKALSTDQKPHSPGEKARIEEAGGIVLNIRGINRVNGLLAVARAFGDIALKRYIVAEPEVTVHQLQEHDAFIVIATDGLWDVFSNEAVASFVKTYLNMPLDSLALKLANMAIELGSTDNITALIVDVR
ncbi:protein phosphatase 2C [Achlya hypogyna]|uniref:Protein phosphatase 2C n=1 Tax=Achlya hypogyna TaxID=1202772 RepID=A0A1V9Z4X2_ACHHY|nr:protein phosphatase 2C [Achlya hypogyna]